jgi:hypothetical protein
MHHTRIQRWLMGAGFLIVLTAVLISRFYSVIAALAILGVGSGLLLKAFYGVRKAALTELRPSWQMLFMTGAAFMIESAAGHLGWREGVAFFGSYLASHVLTTLALMQFAKKGRRFYTPFHTN